jgi:hypothetical protein
LQLPAQAAREPEALAASNLKEVPDDGLLVDLLGEIARTAAQREALLVATNPQRFYRFEK